MMAAPLELLKVEEHPESAREKLVTLSPAGLAAVEAMAGRGEAFIQRIVDELNEQEIEEGMRFMSRVSDITKLFDASS